MKTKKVRANTQNGRTELGKEPSGARHERIAMRAYQLYLARGAVEGEAIKDWLEAEREIGGTNGPAGSP